MVQRKTAANMKQWSNATTIRSLAETNMHCIKLLGDKLTLKVGQLVGGGGSERRVS